ncbi:MAG: hypothetical protein AAF217_08975 [Pseudomonadota bacterium]
MVLAVTLMPLALISAAPWMKIPLSKFLEFQTNERLTQNCQFNADAFSFVHTACQFVLAANTKHKMDLHFLKPVTFRASEKHRPITSIAMLSGEKSILAGQGQFMSMAVVETENGELVPDGTEVRFLYQGDKFFIAKTIGGIAHFSFNAPRRSGYVSVIASARNISTIPDIIRVVPSEPVSVDISKDFTVSRIADDRQIWFTTKPMLDHFGNRIADGGFIQFSATDNEGQWAFINAASVNGVARAKFIQRKLRNEMELRARHKDIIGQPVAVPFNQPKLLPTVDLEFQMSDGKIDLVMGPIRYANGTYVGDGYPVSVETESGRQISARTINGIAAIRFSQSNKLQTLPLTLKTGERHWKVTLSDTGQSLQRKRLTDGARL